MKILHILDHSIPLHSGYTFRTRSILEQQRAMGWETAHITSSKHNGTPRPSGERGRGEGRKPTQSERPDPAADLMEEVEGFRFYRTPPASGILTQLPVVSQWEVVRALERRLAEVIADEGPDILHAHSPALNGIAAVRVGRRLGLPVVYECRAFWEDAAADHGTSREGGLRYRMTRGLDTWVIRHGCNPPSAQLRH